jgi:hypothetical protein
MRNVGIAFIISIPHEDSRACPAFRKKFPGEEKAV